MQDALQVVNFYDHLTTTEAYVFRMQRLISDDRVRTASLSGDYLGSSAYVTHVLMTGDIVLGCVALIWDK